jgi:hypothetical protein
MDQQMADEEGDDSALPEWQMQMNAQIAMQPPMPPMGADGQPQEDPNAYGQAAPQQMQPEFDPQNYNQKQ